jgi:murein DD-endopeptidase MepM/ murein hydrolase activator NlpD
MSHMSVFHVRRGDWVQVGSIIGLSGGAVGTPGAGHTTGPHLDLMVRTDGINTPANANMEDTDDPKIHFYK